MTGERPTLGTSPTNAGTDTGDPNIDLVLSMLDRVDLAVFSAGYTATANFGGLQTPITATQVSPTQRAVTVGDVRYVTDGDGSRTCTVSTTACTPGTDATRISDTGVTSDVLFGDIPKRLRRFAGSRTGPTTASSNLIAGQNAHCVDLPLGANIATYCTLDNGLLARLIDGDVTIEMSGYSPTPDPSMFEI